MALLFLFPNKRCSRLFREGCQATWLILTETRIDPSNRCPYYYESTINVEDGQKWSSFILDDL